LRARATVGEPPPAHKQRRRRGAAGGGRRHRGRVRIEIAGELGETVLAPSDTDLDAMTGDALTISTTLSRPLWQCEIRLF